MLQRIKKFFQLDGKEMLLFLEAYTTLALTRLALLVLPFERLTRSLTQKSKKNRISILSYHTMLDCLTISRMIYRAANNTPWESACLVQSLCTHQMLQRRGIGGVFYLGVMKDNETKEKMKAHAWSESGGKILTGGAGQESYTVIAVYTWGKQ
jgi:Transglutaminase-like superfamily